MRLDGRTALVTGGTQGVGAAIARALARAGCDLVLHGLQEDEQSQETVANCRQIGSAVHCVYADLSDAPSGTQTLLEEVLSVAPQTSLLVNNAGTYCDKPFLEMDWQTLEKTMHLNVFAGFLLVQAFSRQWIQRGVAGRVVFTGSINGLLSEADHTAYDASKGAVHALVRSLCVSLAPHRIRVNAMAPGLVQTPLTRPALDADSIAWMKLHTPNGQVPDAEACGGAAVFLLSDEAEHIHGQTLFVDGGMSAWQQPDLPEQLRGQLNRSLT